MKWIDNKKGILDYVFSAIPLFTLFFLIFAYFHTVHPRFSKEEELKIANLEIEKLKKEVGLIRKEELSLETIVGSLRAELSGVEQQLSFVESKYLASLSQSSRDSYLDNNEHLYFTKQEVIDAYKDGRQKLVSESGKTVDPSTIKAIEVNVTGGLGPDLYLVDSWSCGSGGCMGPLFIYFSGAYCFSVWAHSATIDSINKAHNLKCSKFSDDKRKFLSDVLNVGG